MTTVGVTKLQHIKIVKYLAAFEDKKYEIYIYQQRVSIC